MIIELPAFCGYWKWPRVTRMLKRYGFVTPRFDGCMCGLTTGQDGPLAMEWSLVKKPWQLACLRSTLPDVLSVRCDRSHAHAPCAGRVTRSTQSYTPMICDIHKVCKRELCNDSVSCVAVCDGNVTARNRCDGSGRTVVYERSLKETEDEERK